VATKWENKKLPGESTIERTKISKLSFGVDPRQKNAVATSSDIDETNSPTNDPRMTDLATDVFRIHLLYIAIVTIGIEIRNNI
jgi:hypothetical protein